MKKVSRGHGKYVWRYMTMTVTKKKISGGMIGGNTYGGVKLKYQPVDANGFTLYIVKGWWFGLSRQERYAGIYSSPSKNTLLERPGAVNKITTWYRYSGKHSKHTLYPYP